MARHVEDRAEAAEPQPRPDRAEQVPPIQEAGGGELRCSRTWIIECLSAAWYMTGICQIHIAAT